MSDPTSAEISDENLDTLIAVNLVSNVLLTREFLPGMLLSMAVLSQPAKKRLIAHTIIEACCPCDTCRPLLPK
jgi:NAD(P)-dependent dehydrogenase (short-subunit alcohol dehydrogenase family)